MCSRIMQTAYMNFLQGYQGPARHHYDLIWMDLQNLLIDSFFQFAKMIKPFFKLF